MSVRWHITSAPVSYTHLDVYKRQLKRLAETKVFCEYAALSSKLFTVKELPLYLVLETFYAVSSLNDYKLSLIHI